MKSVTNYVRDSRGVSRSVTTLTVTAADQGSVLATNRALTAMRYLTPPSSGRGVAMFELVDDAVPNAVPRTIYRLDLNSQMFAYPQNNSAIYQQLIDGQQIAFGNLTAARVPVGCTIEIDIS
jgi:hypothetical protein